MTKAMPAALGTVKRQAAFVRSRTSWRAAAVSAARARAARSEQATKANATTRAVIAEIQRAGKSTLASIAQELEARGVRTPAGVTAGRPPKSPGCSQPSPSSAPNAWDSLSSPDHPPLLRAVLSEI
jgi:hypothetical protein